MSTISQKEIQQAVNKDDLSIKPIDKKHKKENQAHQNNYGFAKNKWYSDRINFGILLYNFVRLVIVMVTTITFLELERAL
ncbi:MAG: hypothetical protein HeimC2_21590 [Candidatus Heimdallarchaeota archaeon LC_2]|nr:MAG: hypothetical protein HeimC2_21590 [Candidatus Heimdallarchaeota archaeon LC_2]